MENKAASGWIPAPVAAEQSAKEGGGRVFLRKTEELKQKKEGKISDQLNYGFVYNLHRTRIHGEKSYIMCSHTIVTSIHFI